MPVVLKAASPVYRWRIRTRLPERFGQTCWVTARGALNSVRVEFPDGFWCITSRWSVRRKAPTLSGAYDLPHAPEPRKARTPSN